MLRSHRALAQLGCALWLTSCATTIEAPAHARPPVPLSAATLAEFALPEPVRTETLVVAGGDAHLDYWRGALVCGTERVAFHLLRPKGAAPRPLVACLPILAGGHELMWLVASRLAAHGYAAAWTDRVAPALRNQRSPEMNTLFRGTVQHNRMLLRWAEARADLFAPGRVGLVGLSTGGLVGTVLLALEPQVAAGALCLAGADLPSLLLASGEQRVVDWRAWRARVDGIAGTALRREMERELSADPGYFCAAIAAERVLLIHADLDAVVVPANQDLLWEGLGRPRRIRIHPLGHYATGLALDPVVDAICRHFAVRLAKQAGH